MNDLQEVYKKIWNIYVTVMKINSLAKKQPKLTVEDWNILLWDWLKEDKNGRESINKLQEIVKDLVENILPLWQIEDEWKNK